DEPDPRAADHRTRARATGVPRSQRAASGEHARQDSARNNHVPRSRGRRPADTATVRGPTPHDASRDRPDRTTVGDARPAG
ncbi:hypothetical protein OJ597_13285, partial [Streptococcus anginosus]|nr:hypothetical protein [Streptococcus anginosus]